MNDFEGEEGNQEELMNNNNEQNENEGDIEEGLEIMENLIEGHDGEGEYPMEHQLAEGEIDIKKLKEKEEMKINDNKINKEDKKNNVLSSNLPLQLQLDGGQQNINTIEKKEISKKNEKKKKK